LLLKRGKGREGGEGGKDKKIEGEREEGYGQEGREE
jgi:hypothetical protein